MKLKLIIVVAAALSVAALSAGCASEKKEKTPSQKEQAVRQWNQTRGAVVGQLAKNQYEAGNFEESRKSIEQAVKLDPQNSGYHVLSARLWIEQGNLEQAERDLELARGYDPNNAEADYFSGVVNQRWQRSQQALDCYTNACGKNPSELAYVMARAEMLVALNRAPEALQFMQSKAADFEHNPVLHHAIGQLLVDQGHYAEAVNSLRQAMILAPEDANVREHLAMAQFYNHEYRDAAESFARLLRDEKTSKRSDLWLALGECQMQIGKLPDARASFDTATELNPTSSLAWLSLAKVALQLNDTRRAEIVLRKVMTLDGGASSEAHLMFGYLRLRQDKLPEAMSEFQKASTLDRADTVSLCMIGYVLEKTGKPKQAMKYYAAALKLKPDDELATRLMASVDTN